MGSAIVLDDLEGSTNSAADVCDMIPVQRWVMGHRAYLLNRDLWELP